MKLWGLSLIILFSLSACGFAGIDGSIRNRTNDYLQAEQSTPLKVPADQKEKVRPVKKQFSIPAGEPAKEPASIVPPGIFE